MRHYLWTHRPRTRQDAITGAIVLFIQTVGLCAWGVFTVRMIRAYTDPSPWVASFILWLSLTVFFGLNQYFSARNYIRTLTTRYGLTDHTLHIEYGFLQRTEETLPLAEVEKIQRIDYNDRPFTSLLLVTDTANTMQGYDFDRAEPRQWPSIERLREPEKVVSLIHSLQNKLSTTKSVTADKDVESQYRRTQVLAALCRTVGIAYLLLAVSMWLYAIDVMLLPGISREETVTISIHEWSRRRSDLMALQCTDHGHCFHTYSIIATEGKTIGVTSSPLFNRITDVSLNGVSQEKSIVNGMHGASPWIHFITLAVLLVAAGIAINTEGYVNDITRIGFFVAPLGFIGISVFLAVFFGL